MAEAERRDNGWGDNKADMQMIIRRGDGREVVREVKTQTLEGEGGRDKGLGNGNRRAYRRNVRQ